MHCALQSTFICITSLDSQGIFEEGRARVSVPACQIEKRRPRPWDLSTEEKDMGGACAMISHGTNGTDLEGSLHLEPEAQAWVLGLILASYLALGKSLSPSQSQFLHLSEIGTILSFKDSCVYHRDEMEQRGLWAIKCCSPIWGWFLWAVGNSVLSSAGIAPKSCSAHLLSTHIQWHPVVDLNSIMVRICTPRKWANATNQSFAFSLGELVVSQHTVMLGG